MRTPDRSQHGFTLSEVMVTVAVMGILFAITAPSISGLLRSNRLNGASNVLVGDLRYARALASEQRTTYEIRFSGDRYSLVRVSPYTVITTRDLPTGVDCAASDTASFYAWGLTAPVTITMWNQSHVDTIQLSANGNVTRD